MPRLPLLPSLVRLACVLALVSSATASAGVRVWEQNPDDPDKQLALDLGGFVQPGLIWRQADPTTAKYSQNTDSGFYLQRARINLSMKFTKFFIAKFELEMFPVPEIQDAYVMSEIAPWFTIRAGQFLVPFLQSFQFNEANISFLDRQIYLPQTYSRNFLRYLSPRDIGLSIQGAVGNLSKGSTSPVFEYNLGVFNGGGASVANNPDQAFEYATRLQLHILGVPLNRQAESDLIRNPTPHVSVAVGGLSNCDDRKNWNLGWTSDAEFRYQGIYASASFVWFHNGPAYPGNILNYNHFCNGGQVPENLANGAHAQLQYVLPRSVFNAFGGAIEALFRWDYATPFAAPVGFLGSTSTTAKGFVPPPNYDDADNSPARYRITAGVNWYPTSSQTLRLSVNYQYTVQTEPLLVGDQYVSLAPSLLWLQLTAGI